MIRILQDVFRAMIKKKYGEDENFDIVINADKGDLEIMRFREIVDDNSEDIWDFDKITLSDAKKIEKDFEIGDEVAEEIKIEDFGRRAIILAKQTLIQRVKDLEKEVIINKRTRNNPFWIMRQARRNLPEFREIRKNNPDFIKKTEM